MRTRNLLIAGLAAAAIAAGVSVTAASASIPTPSKGNLTVLASSPRLAPSPGALLAAGATETVKIAGETFGGVAIPANATGVTLSVSNNQSAGAGKLTVWTTEVGKPGTPNLAWAAGESETTVAFVALNSEGKLNVSATVATRYLASISSYVTPLAVPAAPERKSIAKTERGIIQVGGSIRAKSTDLGSVTLSAGTWDARVVASFQGFNAVNNTVPADVFLTGSVVLVDDSNAGTPSDPFDFSDVKATVGGTIIPDAQSATLTQDPTAAISQFITLTAPTTLHVRAFAYASDSGTDGSGELKAGLDTAEFVKIS